MAYLFDSNILIYHLNGCLNPWGTDLLENGLVTDGKYSIISKIELLGFSPLASEDSYARKILSKLEEIPLDSRIAEQTIVIRRSYKIKVPDAIIAATALVHKCTLITRNSKDFEGIKKLSFINPFSQRLSP